MDQRPGPATCCVPKTGSHPEAQIWVLSLGLRCPEKGRPRCRSWANTCRVNYLVSFQQSPQCVRRLPQQ